MHFLIYGPDNAGYDCEVDGDSIQIIEPSDLGSTMRDFGGHKPLIQHGNGFLCSKEGKFYFGGFLKFEKTAAPQSIQYIKMTSDGKTVNINMLDILVHIHSDTPYLSLSGERSLQARLAGKGVVFTLSENGQINKKLTQKDALKLLEDHVSCNIYPKIFPLASIKFLSQPTTASTHFRILKTCLQNPGLLYTEGLERAADSGSFLKVLQYMKEPRLFGYDFSEYQPLYRSLNVSEQQLGEILDACRKMGEHSYNFTINYVLLSILKIHGAFTQSLDEVLDLIDTEWFCDVLDTAYQQGVSVQRLLDYIQEQMTHRRSVGNLLSTLGAWFRRPEDEIYGNLPKSPEKELKRLREEEQKRAKEKVAEICAARKKEAAV